MLKISKAMLALVVALVAAPEFAISADLYVCSDYVNLRNKSLSKPIGLLHMGTKVEKISRRTKSPESNPTLKYSRYRINNTMITGWVANKFICSSNPGLPYTEYKQSSQEQNISALEREVVINLTNNVLYYYEKGSLVRSWNVGTARAGKVTPTGKFKIWNKDICPPYFGSLGDKNVPGCTPQNPFGPKALWFQGFMYGIHGTNEGYLLSPRSTANSRRVSSGCIRNENSNINWLFDKVKIGDQVTITW